MTGVSGVRGVFADTLNPFIVQKYVARFAYYQRQSHPEIKPSIVVGRDSRTTGLAMLHSIVATLISMGFEIVDLGIVSTPTVLLAVEQSDAIGGICITASHNPPQWNAMKFVDADGMFLTADKAAEFLAGVDEPITWSAWDNMGKLTHDDSAIQRHIDKVLAIPYIDVELIKSKHIKVVLDSVNGAGGLLTPKLLKQLGCTVYEINSEATGVFAHVAEPLNENLGQLEEAVKFYNAEIGFATDPDVDRLSIVSEKGSCIGEELTVALSELYVLQKNPGDVVVNLSSSMISDAIAARFGVSVHRTRIGEINVGKKMQELRSPIGGEGNGGVICPDVHYTRDALAGIALILALMSESGKSVSQLVDSLPKYYFAKDKVSFDSSQMDAVMQAVPAMFASYNIDNRDGIKAIAPDHWIHIRKSGTEPIIRIYVESDDAAKSRKICDDAIAKLRAVAAIAN